MLPKDVRVRIRRRQYGIGRFRPQCLQFLACIEGYIFLLCIFALCSGSLPMYTISQITSIEKHFRLSSKQSGLVVGSSEIGFLTTSLITGHFLSTSHRPRILAICLVLLGCGAVFMASPGLDHLVNDVEETDNVAGSGANNSVRHICTTKPQLELNCPVGIIQEFSPTTVISMLMAASVLIGIGSSCLWTLGLSYIDDNSSKKKSPRYLGIVLCLRFMAPVLGLALGTAMAKFPVHLHGEYDDIGAWWLGYIIIGLVALTAAIPLFFFPEELDVQEDEKTFEEQTDRRRSLLDPEALSRRRSQAGIRRESAAKADGTPATRRISSLRRMSTMAKESVTEAALTARDLLKTFPAAMWRLFKNISFVFVCLSVTIDVAAFVGYTTFAPKYFETQFYLDSTYANLITGMAIPLASAVGVFLSGCLMALVKIRLSRQIFICIIVLTVVYCVQPLLVFIKCDAPSVQGIHQGTGSLNDSVCIQGCHCDDSVFDAVCGGDGQTYYSPCHAGCATYTEEPTVMYSNCACVNVTGTAVPGYCSQGCSGAVPYAVLLSAFNVVTSITTMPLLMLILRVVEPRDKCLGLAVFNLVTSLGILPAPTIFGSYIDQTCIFHLPVSKCSTASQQNSCALYDADALPITMHVGQLIRILGPLLLVISWYMSRNQVFAGDVKDSGQDLVTPVSMSMINENVTDKFAQLECVEEEDE